MCLCWVSFKSGPDKGCLTVKICGISVGFSHLLYCPSCDDVQFFCRYCRWKWLYGLIFEGVLTQETLDGRPQIGIHMHGIFSGGLFYKLRLENLWLWLSIPLSG